MAVEGGEILVVDDNRMSRLKLALSLQQQGHRVSAAEDGRQALDMLCAGRYDVVLLDIVMPGMDGYQVLERMKSDSALRDIPVIVISALDEVESAVRCIEIGAEDYLPKSFNPVLLRARLNASLQKKKLRDLERAYLQQEVMLRESEKLATLGRLTAGMAHELNNPAAAALRGVAELGPAVSRLQQIHFGLSGHDAGEALREALDILSRLALERARQPVEMDALERSDREGEIEAWLTEIGIQDAWEAAPSLVSLGYDRAALEALSARFDHARFLLLVELLNGTYTIYRLLEETGQSVRRISDIVNALKAYTHLDQAAIQAVDVNADLDNTLAVMGSRLGAGMVVQRDYAPDLPRVEAHAGELNQVWTNLIDNAIDATGGRGQITLRTRYAEPWVIIEVEDDGPGIPVAIQSRLFDPFFTTKPPGQGAGLGLTTSHSIVVQMHGGQIDVDSRPGSTLFQVRLPLQPPVPQAG
ncbi:MAG TPA: response regulator [Anaerolineae bacterium]